MRVVLIGDSIRIGYEPMVRKKLEGRAEVLTPDQNCCYSIWMMAHFQKWVADQKPDIVHFNFGIHDSRILPDGFSRICLEQYKLCVQRFINEAKALGDIKIIWATTTPCFEPDKEKPMRQWERHAHMDAYNEAALNIAKAENIAINDLYSVVMDNDFIKCMFTDGIHMEIFGNECLSNAVIKSIEPYL